MRGAITLAALALLTAGCATYSWYRPDTPAELAAQDDAECYDLARDSARDIALSAFPRFYGPAFYSPLHPWPYGAWGAWGDPHWGPGGDPMWRMDVERRIHNRCMRSRGYELYREPKA